MKIGDGNGLLDGDKIQRYKNIIISATEAERPSFFCETGAASVAVVVGFTIHNTIQSRNTYYFGGRNVFGVLLST